MRNLFQEVRSVPDRLKPQDLVRQARHRAHLVRGEGRERLWNLQVQALERAEDWLGKAPGWLGADRMTQVVQRRLESATALPVEGYEQLNAKDASAAVRELDRVALLKIRRWEEANKDRKTVIAAIERRLAQLDAPPPSEAPLTV